MITDALSSALSDQFIMNANLTQLKLIDCCYPSENFSINLTKWNT